MTDKPPIVNLDGVERERYGKGGEFTATLSRVGMHLGTKKIGCTLVELEPGKKAWPYHLHFGQEEMFVILDGVGTLRYDDTTYAIGRGDVVFAPPGPGTAHQIINTSNDTLRYLALSSDEDPEICYYPDSQKIGAYAGDRDTRALTFIVRENAGTDYWEGEE